MNEHDAEVFKILAELGMTKESLSDEQEELLQRALDPEKEFEYNVKRIFANSEND